VRVALTFDAEHPDRPHRAGVADEILALLADERVRATFFLQGRWATAHPHTAERIARDGHLVGSHSFSHARLPRLSPDGMRSDVQAAERAILEIAGADPHPWFRCPYGAGWCDPSVRGVLHELGYRHVGWDVIVEDWEPSRDGEAVARDVLDGVARSDGEAVVLLHSWPESTLEALPAIISCLREDGNELVGDDELEHVPEAAAC
jgi:peptidoglycan/xylan/chitin deacetylase (PgdA/CDA1 family)